MIKDDFVHLHCHSDYSLYDGFQKIDDMVIRAHELGMKGIAITDHGKVGSFIKFYKKAKSLGIKPIFGIEAYISNDLENKKSSRYHLTILAKNYVGYKNILKIASKSHNYIVKIFNNEIPRIDFEILKKHSEGLIVLSGCIASEFSKLIVENRSIDLAKELCKKYKNIWGDDFYIEVMYTKYAPQLFHLKHAEKIAKELDIKVVATNDCHFTHKKDAQFQNAKISLSRNKPYFPDGDNSEYYIKSYSEMKKYFNKERLIYLNNTMEVLDKCDVNLELGKAQLPHFEIPTDDKDFNSWKNKIWRKSEEEQYLQYLAEKGLQKLGLWSKENYRERLYKELETIRFTGFTRYFLIVRDYCDWAREQDILIGMGRGSGVGSLVLYSLGVTGVDPIKRSLSMNRFLYAEAKYRARVEDFFSIQKKEQYMHGEDCICDDCSNLSKETKCIVSPE